MLYIVGLAPTLRINIELRQPTNLETTIIALVKRFYLTNTKIETSTPSTTKHSHIEISLHAVIGITTSQTMQVQITINGRDFLTLLDSGSTHNFIDSETAAALNLNRTEALDNITVAVANDNKISNAGIHSTT
jgi:predicted aspartyl protease